jgi:hypothetical protein
MSILEFFPLYHHLLKDFGTKTMSFAAWAKLGLVWIDPKGHYSNNKHWDQEFFFVLGEWESPVGEVFPEEQRVPQQWGTLMKEWDELPKLTQDQKKRVKAALKFTEAKTNTKRDFGVIVTDASLRGMFVYQILEGNLMTQR